MGVEFNIKYIQVNGQVIKLQMWDTVKRSLMKSLDKRVSKAWHDCITGQQPELSWFMILQEERHSKIFAIGIAKQSIMETVEWNFYSLVIKLTF